MFQILRTGCFFTDRRQRQRAIMFYEVLCSDKNIVMLSEHGDFGPVLCAQLTGIIDFPQPLDLAVIQQNLVYVSQGGRG